MTFASYIPKKSGNGVMLYLNLLAMRWLGPAPISVEITGTVPTRVPSRTWDRDVDLTLHLSDTLASVVPLWLDRRDIVATHLGRVLGFFANLYVATSGNPTTTMNVLDCHNTSPRSNDPHNSGEMEILGTGLPSAYKGKEQGERPRILLMVNGIATQPTHVKHRCHTPASWGRKNWRRYAPP